MLDEDRAEHIKLQASLKVDRRKKEEYPPVAISIGEEHLGPNVYPIPYGTYGNFSLVVAPKKSGKSYFVSLLVASYIGGNANHYAPTFKTHREGLKYINHFDTEQGHWHASMGATRVDKIVGDYYENYNYFKLRELDFDAKLDFIDKEIHHNKYNGNLGLVIIDGIADLILEGNDQGESNSITQRIMKWSSELDTHIILVIHNTYGVKKATGHLGSYLEKKAETICYLDREKNLTKVSFETRGFGIDEFAFTLDNYGLPIIEDIEY